MYRILHPLCVGVNEPPGLTTTWLSCRARPIFPFFDHSNGRGWADFICNGSVCTLARSWAAFCSAKLQHRLSTFGANPASLLHVVTFSCHLLTWKLWSRWHRMSEF